MKKQEVRSLIFHRLGNLIDDNHMNYTEDLTPKEKKWADESIDRVLDTLMKWNQTALNRVHITGAPYEN